MLENSVIIGSYLPVTSPLSRLDVRTKIIGFCFLLYGVLSSNKAPIVMLNVTFTVFLATLTRVPFTFWLRCLLRFSPMLLITFLLNLFFTSPGFYYEIAGFVLPVGKDSMASSATTTFQLLCAILLALILTFSTPPTELVNATQWLAKPLSRLKIPVQDLALVMFMAMRFIPFFQLELNRIVEAQKSRGINFQDGSVIDKGKRLLGILHPAFMATIGRSENLAVSMSARGFTRGVKRTFFRQRYLSQSDSVALMILIGYFIARNLIIHECLLLFLSNPWDDYN